jgi:beta-lactamase class D
MRLAVFATRPSAAFAALFVSLAALGGDSSPLPQAPEHYFGEFGYCALVLERSRLRETYREAGSEQCSQALSPCSTFKIPNALIGLQTGVVSGPDDLKKWDGKQRARVVSNRDHTLASAISQSIVWYFQALARDVGEERMAAWLEKLDYGNRDISGGIDNFWLASSLKIDAYAQLELIKSLWHGALPFEPDKQVQVRDMLTLETGLDGVLHGKTGGCPGGAELNPIDHGWFVGWVDWNEPRRQDPYVTFFVVNITGNERRGQAAKQAALEILQDLHPSGPAKPTTE